MPSLLAATLDLVLPRCCIGCAGAAEALCSRCRAAVLAPQARRVGPLTVRGAGRYAGVVQTMLIAYKERGRRDLARPLAGLLADLKQRGTLAAAVIGSVVAADAAGVIEVTS